MRISNTMLTDNFLKNLNNNLEDTINYQEKVATGKRISRLSEDPVGAISVMSSKMQIYRIEQYQKNINSTEDMIMQAEDSVLELNEMVKSAITNATQASNGTMTGEDKKAIAALIGQYKEHAIAIGNASVAGKYIFGGYNTKSAPFEVAKNSDPKDFDTVTYNGDNLSDETVIEAAIFDANGELKNVIEYEIAENKTMQASLLGTEIFGYGSDNLYAVLDDLENKLLSDASSSDISESIGKLQEKQSDLLNVESKIGGMSNRMDLMRSRYERDWLNNTETLSEIQDVDYAEAYMKFSQANAVYTAALQISSKIIQNSLVDYLK